MTPWTAAAKEELERYFRRVRASLAASGADAAEVIDDLRRHLDEEAAAAKLVMVTEEDARRLLARIGTPEFISASEGKGSLPEEIETKKPEERSRRRPGIWLLLLGAVLPLITLLMEWQTGMCAGAFFDPMPTVWHFLLVAWVPAANALAWLAVARGREKFRRHLGWANGVAIGVAIFYSVLFVPLLLPGVIAVVFFGWGLLPWTPVLSLVAALLLRRHLREMSANRSAAALPGLGWGVALAWVLLVTVDAPVWGTRYGLHLAVAEEAAVQHRGLRWLRALGHEETLLRACYGRGRWADNMDLVGWLIAGGERVPPEKARDIYYRVTGRAFNTVPAPTVRTGRGRWKALDDWTWDADQGGQQVGGRIKGLTMQGSRLDATVDGAAALGYCEWTLEFKNDSRQQREARAQILLPPGGVVSRLTLWVNGEEREAAFAGRSHVREAYQKVAIRQRRDPVLITTCGPDRVLMQCFPVPSNGGVMKVRLGMTAPLQLEGIDRGRWCWPRFLERNFTLTETLRHSVWVEAKESLATDGPALRVEQPRTGYFAARGQLDEAALAAPQNAVHVQRDSAAREVWTRDVRSGKNGIIRQQIKELAASAPQRVVFVVDTSRGMEEHFAAVAKAIRLLPGGSEVALFLATDEFGGLLEAENKSRVFGRQPAVERLAGLKGVGGQDNVPALVRAWDAAAEKSDSAIVWIHGPQPVVLESVEALQQRYERRPGGPSLYEIQTGMGPNRIVEKLDGVAAIHSVPRLGEFRKDLEGLLAGWNQQTKRTVCVRESLAADAAVELKLSQETPLHLARLWAREEVLQLFAARQAEAAVQLAARYQIVTPVSGAVVLETKEQYQQTGLEPADPTTVPAIPEPASRWFWLAGLVLLWLAGGGRKARER